jgi:hypothetical protein
MLLIVEVMLTVAAWRKGWGAWALLPLGAMLPAGFAIGALFGPPVAATPLPILLDLAAIVALIGLNTMQPRSTSNTIRANV